MRTRFAPIFLAVALLAPLGGGPSRPPATCTRSNGLLLPDGFCATVVATHLAGLRQIAVAPNGDLYAALQDGGVVALRDANGDGQADLTKSVHDGGGTGIALHAGQLWFAQNDKILRWALTPGELVPGGAPEVVVEGLPTGGHTAKTFAFLGGDTLIVNIGSATNSCQFADRARRSPGKDPCTELEGRAGLWRFSTARLHQRQRDGVRYATGLRNAMALAVEPGTGRLYAAPHGRDQLGQNWGFTDEQSAELPSEEFMQVEAGDDFGWPYCYYDWQQKLRLPRALGADGDRVLSRNAVPGEVPRRRVHRVPRFVEPCPASAAGIPRGVHSLRRAGASHGGVRDLRHEREGPYQPPSRRARGWPGRFAIHCRPVERYDLADNGAVAAGHPPSSRMPWLPLPLGGTVLKPLLAAAFAASLLTAAPTPVAAQQKPTPLAIGDTAPDFTLPTATRDGILPLPAKLRDFRGHTVVLAFFYKARTGG